MSDKKIRTVYFGTPDFSAELLGKLLNDASLPIEIVAVVTQPARPAGRKMEVRPSPVAELASKHSVPVFHDLRDFKGDIDLALLFAYGQILPEKVLSIPKFGFWDVHPSLLPLYRGPSPVAAPLLEGKSETGVTIMKMDSLMDHGPIIAQKKRYIFPLDRHDQLMEKLVDEAYEMLCGLFTKYAPDLSKAPQVEQDHTKATYTKLLKKDDGYIERADLSTKIGTNDSELFNRYRALYPWPGIWTFFEFEGRKLRLKITKIYREEEKIVIKKVQLEGKNEVDYATFTRAYGEI
jgi:methionyl-tRNA formyltransferase